MNPSLVDTSSQIVCCASVNKIWLSTWRSAHICALVIRGSRKNVFSWLQERIQIPSLAKHPLIYTTHVRNKNSNTQGSSPNVVKVIFHTPRNCSLIVENPPLEQKKIAWYNSLHLTCVTFSTFLRSGYAIDHWSGPSSNADLVDLWCFRGSSIADRLNPIFCDFSRGPDIPSCCWLHNTVYV